MSHLRLVKEEYAQTKNIGKITVSVDQYSKIGINEVLGLKAEMIRLMKPIQEQVKSLVYWDECELQESEYKARDGFLPYSHNCGGLELSLIVPKCEEYDFDFLDFGKCDECKPGDNNQCGYNSQECAEESEGYLNARLRIWFKFEGISDSNKLQFYLYAGGGNGDAPYFRTKYETTIFEAAFECASVAGLQRAASKHIKQLIKKIGG